MGLNMFQPSVSQVFFLQELQPQKMPKRRPAPSERDHAWERPGFEWESESEDFEASEVTADEAGEHLVETR